MCGIAVSASQMPSNGSLTVMTYNIKGSAWPIATGRPAAFRQIVSRLRAMRLEGNNPQIVVLQEAFSAQARSIGREAGYPFVVDGPGAGDRNDAPMTPADRRFAAAASFWCGERIGKVVGSGLQILSDYPITRISRMVYPGFACAGYDCLANKGALMVTVRVPGAATSVDILTTHLNCKHHSGVSDDRSLYAYQRQVDFLTAFINQAHDPAIPLIAAGDFNDGRSQSRGLALRAEVPQWHGAEPFHEALSQFVNDEGLRGMAVQGDVDAVLHHGADWQFFTSGLHSSLQLVGIAVPFGLDGTGRMLSDHIGYVVQFRLGRLSKPGSNGALCQSLRVRRSDGPVQPRQPNAATQSHRARSNQ